MSSKPTQRQYEAGRCNRASHAMAGQHLSRSEEPLHHISQCTARCMECSGPQNHRDRPPCNSVPGQSRGPHRQCTEPGHHYATPSAQQQYRARCTECGKPQDHLERPPCNSVPGQSRGPYHQCTEESFYYLATPSAQHQYTARCTERSRPHRHPERSPCVSVPGQSRGPHRQCT